MTRAAEIEQHAAAAWPATHSSRSGGWLLRHTPGVGKRRNNSALPYPGPVVTRETVSAPAAGSALGAVSPPATGSALEAVESYYSSHGLPVIIQISPAEQHAELDAALAAQGYTHDAPTLVMTAPVVEVAGDAPPVAIDSRLTPEWRKAYGNDAVSTHILDRITRPTGFASVTVNGEIAALGLFVAGDTLSGIFCMATATPHRRRGHAAAILRAGAAWSAEQGADLLYLQVEKDNTPARHLYERVGFTTSHSYHYRVHPHPTA
ncbi:GNAT family N-acetyltransferase [Actinoplanes sp. G11-F43]|uniref:GNAT family N-acetyltransferase n=1 Tax=Actinoplanes sp. G11-F43 TaxID=3424130 RepID=UPI003D351D74